MSEPSGPEGVTRLLVEWQNGNQGALDSLIPLVYRELRAIAGVTYPLVNPSYTPDGAAGAIYDLEDPSTNVAPLTYMKKFPYLNTPYSGFEVPK